VTYYTCPVRPKYVLFCITGCDWQGTTGIQKKSLNNVKYLLHSVCLFHYSSYLSEITECGVKHSSIRYITVWGFHYAMLRKSDLKHWTSQGLFSFKALSQHRNLKTPCHAVKLFASARSGGRIGNSCCQVGPTCHWSPFREALSTELVLTCTTLHYIRVIIIESWTRLCNSSHH
jgi:hypothetical protein